MRLVSMKFIREVIRRVAQAEHILPQICISSLPPNVVGVIQGQVFSQKLR
jgi:hypothetical protein